MLTFLFLTLVLSLVIWLLWLAQASVTTLARELAANASHGLQKFGSGNQAYVSESPSEWTLPGGDWWPMPPLPELEPLRWPRPKEVNAHAADTQVHVNYMGRNYAATQQEPTHRDISIVAGYIPFFEGHHYALEAPIVLEFKNAGHEPLEFKEAHLRAAQDSTGKLYPYGSMAHNCPAVLTVGQSCAISITLDRIEHPAYVKGGPRVNDSIRVNPRFEVRYERGGQVQTLDMGLDIQASPLVSYRLETDGLKLAANSFNINPFEIALETGLVGDIHRFSLMLKNESSRPFPFRVLGIEYPSHFMVDYDQDCEFAVGAGAECKYSFTIKRSVQDAGVSNPAGSLRFKLNEVEQYLRLISKTLAVEISTPGINVGKVGLNERVSRTNTVTNVSGVGLMVALNHQDYDGNSFIENNTCQGVVSAGASCTFDTIIHPTKIPEGYDQFGVHTTLQLIDVDGTYRFEMVGPYYWDAPSKISSKNSQNKSPRN